MEQPQYSPPTGAARWVIGGLLLFGALNAVAGGIYGVLGAEGVPRSWLEGTPFVDYVIPSLILMLVVGGSWLFAGLAVIKRWSFARIATIGASDIMLGWIFAQVATIGLVSWLQPATASVAITVLTITGLLRKE
mgnify:CR=1 FL=1